MKTPILLIIEREFMSRVRKKTFLLMTLLAPVLLASLMILPGVLASMPQEDKSLIVLDEPSMLLPEKGTSQFSLDYLDPREFDLELAKTFLKSSNHDALLYIPTGEGWDPDFIKNNIKLFGKEEIGIDLQRFAERLLEEKINQQKLVQQGVDPEVVAQSKTKVRVQSFKLGEEGSGDQSSATGFKMGLGYIAGMTIYFFIFFYAVQVMRGVIEEKTSRIVEVIISSVRPRQLMMGKILGIGMVGVVQFLIWVLLSGTIYTIISTFVYPEIFAQQMPTGPDASGDMAFDQNQIFAMITSINYPVVLGGFVFYFFGGYFLYSALFAALGSAIDAEADSQQFMLPVTAPMIIAIITASSVVQNPDGPLAFWLSIFPLTAPITMMVRIPFGVPLWEIGLSAGLLVASFFGVVALAGKIYRVGILMYGKKVSWKELYKWINY